MQVVRTPPVDEAPFNCVRVGYDDGFVLADWSDSDLDASEFPFRLRINGWGQLRHTIRELDGPHSDLNQFQLKRGRITFAGNAFTDDFSYFFQMDGRSSSGDGIRLLDYFLSYDVGHHQLGMERGRLGFRTGKYKMPFTMARWLSGREFEFADRSMASTFFDVNRSLACGVYGRSKLGQRDLDWEAAIFNGLVSGGAETGSSGMLDNNFAYSARVSSVLFGDWGAGQLADFDGHECPAIRVGMGLANSEVDRSGDDEFRAIRVVDSGQLLADLLPPGVSSYGVTLYSADVSLKYRGWSSTIECYLRDIGDISGGLVPRLSDHGFWLQTGYFVLPNRVQLLSRWSRVAGNSGTLGAGSQSADEVAGAIAWYFRENHAKCVLDVTHLNRSPIDSAALDISPGTRGWLIRSQIQFSF